MSSPQSALRTITLRTCQVVQQLLLQNQASHAQDAIILQCELLYRYICLVIFMLVTCRSCAQEDMLYDFVLDVCMCIKMHV